MNIEEKKKEFYKKFKQLYKTEERKEVDLQSMLMGGDKTVYGRSVEYISCNDEVWQWIEDLVSV